MAQEIDAPDVLAFLEFVSEGFEGNSHFHFPVFVVVADVGIPLVVPVGRNIASIIN